MISIPLSAIGSAAAFQALVAAHLKALSSHRTGPARIAAPTAPAAVEAVVLRVPATGPVATRGPDTFTIAPYAIVDDTPKPPEVAAALSVLRETLA